MSLAPAFDREDSSPFDKLVASLRERQLFSALEEPVGLAVDLGSGFRAPLLRRLLARGHIRHGYAVDLSVDGQIAHSDLSVQQMDLNEGIVSLADETVEFLMSLAVLEHLANPENLVREAYRLLAPGRTLFLTTPSPLAQPVLELMAYRLKLIDEAGIRDHKHYFTTRELEELFTRCGFRQVRVSRFLFGLNTMVVGIK